MLHQYTKNVSQDCLWSLFFRRTECTGSSTIVQLSTLLQHTVDFSANETYCFPLAVPIIAFLRFYLCNYRCDFLGTLTLFKKERKGKRVGEKEGTKVSERE